MQAQTFQNLKFSGGNPLDTRAIDGANIRTVVLKCNFLGKTLALGLYHCWKVVLFIVKLTADYLPTSGQFSKQKSYLYPNTLNEA